MSQRVRERRRRFGEFIAERRRRLGLTQEELAERAGISRSYLSLLESGSRGSKLLNIDIINALARALELQPDDLLSLNTLIEQDIDISDERLAELLQHFLSADDEERDRIIRVIRALTE